MTPETTSDQIIQQEHRSRSASAHSKQEDHTVNVPSNRSVGFSRVLNCCQRCCTKETLKEQALLIATVSSVILGIVIGIALRSLKCPTGKLIRTFLPNR